MKTSFTRDFYIPKGSRKIAHKVSGRAVHVYEVETEILKKKVFYACAFLPKSIKPVWHYRYNDAAKREKAIREFFNDGAAKIERNAAWKAEKKIEQEKLNSDIVERFEVGKIYSCRSACDHDCIFSFKVVKRTEKTVWLEAYGKVTARRVRISAYDKCEACDPHGIYSMSPVLHATDGAR